MEEERDLFEGLRKGAETIRLLEFHVPCNPLREHEVSGAIEYCNEYKMIPLLQFKEA